VLLLLLLLSFVLAESSGDVVSVCHLVSTLVLFNWFRLTAIGLDTGSCRANLVSVQVVSVACTSWSCSQLIRAKMCILTSLCLSFCPNVNCWTDFHETLWWKFLQKFVLLNRTKVMSTSCGTYLSFARGRPVRRIPSYGISSQSRNLIHSFIQLIHSVQFSLQKTMSV
jgi:hypothetical protein